MTQDTSIMAITPPNGDAAIAQNMHKYVLERGRELSAEFDEIAARLTPDNFANTKDDWTRLKKIDAELKNVISKVERDAIEYAACNALLVQLAATRKLLKERYESGWAKFCELRDKDKPPTPTHTYVIQVEVTDAGLKSIATACGKVSDKFRFAAPQSDRAFNAINKWFDENQD